jgi:hypothetical protein
MRLTTHQKIDYVLNLLYETKNTIVKDRDAYEYLTLSEITERQDILDENEIHTILEFLVEDQLVLTEILPVGENFIEMQHYKLSIKGFLFIEKTSFVLENKKNKRKQFYEKAKVVAVVLNAIAVLAIMIWGVIESMN